MIVRTAIHICAMLIIGGINTTAWAAGGRDTAAGAVERTTRPAEADQLKAVCSEITASDKSRMAALENALSPKSLMTLRLMCSHSAQPEQVLHYTCVVNGGSASGTCDDNWFEAMFVGETLCSVLDAFCSRLGGDFSAK